MSDAPSPSAWIVIMGAAVRRNGAPSGAMRNRVAAALDAARGRDRRVMFLPTGGVGRYGPAEAQVMASLLQEAGVDRADIVLEVSADDTLSSVEACAAILRQRASGTAVFVATDSFHLPRCLWLFRLYGVAARPAPIPSSRWRSGWLVWLYYCLREVPAVAWDVLLALLRRRRSLR